LLLKLKYKNIYFIHRLNGPISKYRGHGLCVDLLIYSFSKYIADGIIFQSNYSAIENIKFGLAAQDNSITIHNAPSRIFEDTASRHTIGNKINLISSSWSSNMNKGFDFYEYLDKYLDFDNYNYWFIGNSPIAFNNIKIIPPVNSNLLSEYFSKGDIFVAASRNDSCSNVVLEALASGMPILALKSGGHPELVGNGGELFTSHSNIIQGLNKITLNLSGYKNAINYKSIEEVAVSYAEFISTVMSSSTPKKLSLYSLVFLIYRIIIFKLYNRYASYELFKK
jgi:glycosyltransferase involved in cell wall biosynthesis